MKKFSIIFVTFICEIVINSCGGFNHSFNNADIWWVSTEFYMIDNSNFKVDQIEIYDLTDYDKETDTELPRPISRGPLNKDLHRQILINTQSRAISAKVKKIHLMFTIKFSDEKLTTVVENTLYLKKDYYISDDIGYSYNGYRDEQCTELGMTPCPTRNNQTQLRIVPLFQNMGK